MRRWLTVLLLMLLPVQFSWAAAATYCQHEASIAGAQHFGHHEHQHDTDSSVPGDDTTIDEDGSPVSDDDCAYCHLGCAKLLIGGPPPIDVQGSHPVISQQKTPRESHIPDGLERPDRRAA